MTMTRRERLKIAAAYEAVEERIDTLLEAIRALLNEEPDPQRCGDPSCLVCPRKLEVWNKARALLGLEPLVRRVRT